MKQRLSVHITIYDEHSGERREWRMTRSTLRHIFRALRAYKRAPKYLADRFDF